MSDGISRDVLALVRCLGLAGRVPAVRQRAADYTRAYERVVAPIVEATIGRDAPCWYGDRAMCESAAKVSFMLAGYAATAGVPFRADLAVLGAAVTRVYDDLIDEDEDDEGPRRISLLFDGAPFTPTSPAELLLGALYRELERRLGRDRHDPIYAELAAEHEAQIRSRGQRDTAIPGTVLADITERKGGHGTAVLFALMKPGMTGDELALVRNLGHLLQLVDDYLDVAADRKAGITTAATRGEVALEQICRGLRQLRPQVRDFYGRDQPLMGVVYAYLWLGFFRRHLPDRMINGSDARVVTSLARTSART